MTVKVMSQIVSKIQGFLSNSADQPSSSFSSGVNNKQQNPPKEGFDRIGYLGTN